MSRYGSYNVLARALHARLTGRTLHWHSVGEMLFLEHADGLDDDARHQLALPLPENPNLTLTIDFDGIGVDKAPTSRPPAEIVAFARSGTAQDDDRPHDEEQAEAIRETEPAGPVDTSLDDELFASPRRARELAALPAPAGTRLCARSPSASPPSKPGRLTTRSMRRPQGSMQIMAIGDTAASSAVS